MSKNNTAKAAQSSPETTSTLSIANNLAVKSTTANYKEDIKYSILSPTKATLYHRNPKIDQSAQSAP